MPESLYVLNSHKVDLPEQKSTGITLTMALLNSNIPVNHYSDNYDNAQVN